MIRAFEVRNYKSIVDMTLSLTYGEGKAPPRSERDETIPFLSCGRSSADRYAPVLAVYGANASGKSTILAAFNTLQRLLENGVFGLYVPNKLNRIYQTCRLAVDLSLGKWACFYVVEYDGKGIVCEELYKREKVENERCEGLVYRIKRSEAFDDRAMLSAEITGVSTKDYPQERLMEAMRVECSDAKGYMVRPFLWCLVRSFAGLLPLASDVWNEINGRVRVFGHNAFFVSQGVDLLAGNDTDEARQEAMNKIVRLLQKFDFGIRDISVFRQQVQKPRPGIMGEISGQQFAPGAVFGDRGDRIIVDTITSKHLDTDGKFVPFNFMLEESDGTKLTAGLLGMGLWALEKGRTIVIDEIDRSIHPFILSAIVRLFKSPRYNKTNAQLVFTVHDPTLLENGQLRISEVAIVSKTLRGGTTCHRLCDIKGVRNVHNFRKQYLDSAYAGIPFPYI